MIYLAIFVVALVLFFGFLFLNSVEQKKGARILSGMRSALDARVARATGVVAHVDFSAFLWNLSKDVTGRLVHDIAHVSLIAVRSLERLLTRLVRFIRSRVHAPQVVEGKRSAFVETITYFKKTLRRSKETTEPEERVK
ncbi:MAG: hypothetical protein AAB440_00855 [Patescibacteria group bacterium]